MHNHLENQGKQKQLKSHVEEQITINQKRKEPVAPLTKVAVEAERSPEPVTNGNHARSKRNQTQVTTTADLALNLSRMAEGSVHENAVREMMITLTKLVKMGADESEFKILNIALKELRYAFKVFAPYRKIKKVSIFGSARTDEKDPDYKMAFKVGKALARNNFMVITGAGDGIMKAAQGGAGADNGFGVNISLPFEQAANLFIEKDPKLITFKYFFTRKVIFTKESNGIVLFPGGFGTHDEGFEILTLLQTGKCDLMPVVFVENPNRPYWTKWKEFIETCLLERNLISPDDLHLFKIVTSEEEVVKEIVHFYHRYHSLFFAGENLVLRLNHKIEDHLLNRLNEEFRDILVDGKFERTKPLAEELGHPDLNHLERIRFHFDRRYFGRLRQLINVLNDD